MALTLLAANNAQTVLAAGINATATSLTVNSGTGALFPSPSAGVSYFKLTLVDAATGQLSEIVHVTARTGDTMTIDRGQEGTTARAWSANDIAANMMTAGTLSYLLNTIQSLGGLLLNIQVFDGTGSGIYTKTPGTRKIKVIVQGGGGGGGTASCTSTSNAAFAGGGAAGAYAEVFIDSPGNTEVVVVGAGGTPGATGGTSSFGSFVSCPGGGPGAQDLGGSTMYIPSGGTLTTLPTISGVLRTINKSGDLPPRLDTTLS